MLEKLEIKINNLKRKVDKKFIGVAAFMVFGAVAIFGMDMANNFKRQKQQAQDSYNKAMYEMVGYIKNVEVELSKVQLTNTSKLTSTTLASIWKQANLAKDNLDSLPVDQNAMANASKYLSQVSDYSYVLMQQVVSGSKITDEEYADIKRMHQESVQLTNIAIDIYTDLNSGRIKWDELSKVGNEKLSELDVSEVTSNVDKIGKTFQEYEGLIYDGAFSDHLLNSIPKEIENEVEVTQDQAMLYIENIFGKENIEYINSTGESKGRVDLYTFNMKLKNENIRSVNVTKKGCKLYLMISDRKVENQKLTMDEAKEKGLEFLKKIGINDVKDTYYLKTENMAIINYAAVQDDITLYPDLVKVKVALDNGQICSVETQGYTFNHVTRTNTKSTISIDEAKAVLNKNIKIKSEGLAIIPTDSKNEILTYEFKGEIDKKSFLIYVNAQTGMEEKILMIVDTPDGILTM